MPSPSTNEPGLQTTTLARRWLIKTVVLFVFLVGFGAWGLYDALVVYPQRGQKYARFAEYQFLQLVSEEDRFGWERRAAVADPGAEWERLKSGQQLTRADEAKRGWLEALAIVNRLSPEFTNIPRTEPGGAGVPDAPARLAELTKQFTTSQGGKVEGPKPLAGYDIPVQWLITAIGFGGGLWLLLFSLGVVAKKYTWDPSAQRLGLPDGSSLVPADIGEFDKRKWDKFLIFLQIKPGHERHAGKELKLDLYRYHPLEEWVLAMEKTAFPERASEPAPDPAPTEPAAAGPNPDGAPSATP